MKCFVANVLLAGLVIASAPVSAATLIDSTVTLTPVFANGQAQPNQTAIVGAGTEFPAILNYDTQIDSGAAYVDFINPISTGYVGASSQFNGFLLSFAGFTLSSPTLLSGPAPVSAVINSAGQLAVNFAGQAVTAGTTTRIGVTATAIQAAVPEPASWGMMIVGFGAVGASMRSRKLTTRVSYAA